jgi:hypothetical protein
MIEIVLHVHKRRIIVIKSTGTCFLRGKRGVSGALSRRRRRVRPACRQASHSGGSGRRQQAAATDSEADPANAVFASLPLTTLPLLAFFFFFFFFFRTKSGEKQRNQKSDFLARSFFYCCVFFFFCSRVLDFFDLLAISDFQSLFIFVSFFFRSCVQISISLFFLHFYILNFNRVRVFKQSLEKENAAIATVAAIEFAEIPIASIDCGSFFCISSISLSQIQ